MFSISISCLGSDRFIAGSLPRLLSTLGKRDECLLHLDDCRVVPRDLEKIALEDRRLIILRTENRIGFSGGLNLAIKHSSHELIGRVDADDLVTPGRWERHKRYLEKSDIVSGLPLHFFGKQFPFLLPHYPASLGSQTVKGLLVFTNPLIHPAVSFRKPIWNELNGYRDVVSEDYDFWLRAAVKGFSLQRVASFDVIYRHHARQKTKQKNWGNLVSSDSSLLDMKKKLHSQMLIAANDYPNYLVERIRSNPLLRMEFRSVLSMIKGPGV